MREIEEVQPAEQRAGDAAGAYRPSVGGRIGSVVNEQAVIAAASVQVYSRQDQIEVAATRGANEDRVVHAARVDADGRINGSALDEVCRTSGIAAAVKSDAFGI